MNTKRIFQSKYLADSAITQEQWLAEFIVERIAKKEGVTLPVKFWNTAKWKPVFQRQVVAANHLLKKYDLKDIIAALNSPKAKRVHSLGYLSFLEPIILMVGADRHLPRVESATEINFDGDIFEEVNQVLFESKSIKKRLWEQLA